MRTHDFAAIGLGPFNLGLACLAEPVDGLDGIVLESRDDFSWHPGMMLQDATLQVPFMADLVTMADPTSRYSFLNYLKQTGRLYPFYIRESFYPLRAEYDAYCRWAASQVEGVRFGRHVDRVEHDGEAYVLTARLRSGGTETYRARRLVLGTGTRPHVPSVVEGVDGPMIHSADYLTHKAALQATASITVVGSGQSAAEIYLDLLEDIDTFGYELVWATRSPRFFPMEYTKLTLEMTSPEYTRYFQALPAGTRDRLLRDQKGLYKGISGDLVDAIFDTLYRKRVHGDVPTRLLTHTELGGASWDAAAGRYALELRHTELDEPLDLQTEGLVLATGYRPQVPAFVEGIADRIRWDDRGRYDVAAGYTIDHTDQEIFVQNAEEHTHGLIAPDLGMGAYRSSIIIRQMCGREVYPVEEHIAFQEFGVPTDLARHPGARLRMEVGA
ncbi:lysine N(6)-hydroxylase/L-ornithine N(5)-oxygenase family protein [Aeromicrobium stalagmiti]|uniref:lysine N(6)-hydroxylase/L-ornithine N(5)-oxygenase family protein n=1 Tax=Aeromicrobium stalagmiti TaxID=2738988 RepID=UPI001568E3BC|nr:lysine N(6)-hydroxylase/L-ornithine N(5)-oxygenase family protein [Aeromicrobium stalagmiti]NRQ48623.1 lysine N(6)-hydroxylase/L-ornithine N(5)-oxygenase family protein [Aeromicrobium stalagmiti]